MTIRSRYDELHDRYHTILTTKAGTRYERLAALVFKILEDRNVVIHHLWLGGDSSVPHQIDISIENAGKRRRVIIECKDYDLSGQKVGLDILRSFRSVMEDTKAEEGIVLTCTGYTRDAQKYAKAKGIKLAVLREIRAEDLEGMIQTVVVELNVQSHKNHKTTLSLSQESSDLFAAQCAKLGISGVIHHSHPVFFVRGSDRVRFTDFLSTEVNKRQTTKNELGRWEVKTPPDGWYLQVGSGPPIPFNYIVTTYDFHIQRIPIEVISDRIAELVMVGLRDDDIIIFGDQIERRKIDAATGEIV
jgi:Restriction endonuclease